MESGLMKFGNEFGRERELGLWGMERVGLGMDWEREGKMGNWKWNGGMGDVGDELNGELRGAARRVGN
jgi:hypothetical protein